MQPTTIDLDLATHVFQLHEIEDRAAVVVRRRLRRSELLDFFGAPL